MDSRIQTYSGVMIDPLNPRPEDIHIEDIAVALSNLCRYTGHVSRFYSVAEHSVAVSHLVPAEFAVWGLLHDASEAYLGDIARPLKLTPLYAAYREAEQRLMRVICQRFGLPEQEPAEVKCWDHAMLLHEIRALKHIEDPVWKSREYPDVHAPGLSLVGLQPSAALYLFEQRARRLGVWV